MHATRVIIHHLIIEITVIKGLQFTELLFCTISLINSVEQNKLIVSVETEYFYILKQGKVN